jgi:hypothetical protein
VPVRHGARHALARRGAAAQPGHRRRSPRSRPRTRTATGRSPGPACATTRASPSPAACHARSRASTFFANQVQPPQRPTHRGDTHRRPAGLAQPPAQLRQRRVGPLGHRPAHPRQRGRVERRFRAAPARLARVDPVSRRRCSSRRMNAVLTANRSAISPRVSTPSSHADSTRSLRSWE